MQSRILGSTLRTDRPANELLHSPMQHALASSSSYSFKARALLLPTANRFVAQYGAGQPCAPRMVGPTKPVVLITGCSEGGIGYHLCEEYAKKGYSVYATARRLDAMKGLKGVVKECLTLDVTKQESM